MVRPVSTGASTVGFVLWSDVPLWLGQDGVLMVNILVNDLMRIVQRHQFCYVSVLQHNEMPLLGRRFACTQCIDAAYSYTCHRLGADSVGARNPVLDLDGGPDATWEGTFLRGRCAGPL